MSLCVSPTRLIVDRVSNFNFINNFKTILTHTYIFQNPLTITKPYLTMVPPPRIPWEHTQPHNGLPSPATLERTQPHNGLPSPATLERTQPHNGLPSPATLERTQKSFIESQIFPLSTP
jgi:hypothetical protein